MLLTYDVFNRLTRVSSENDEATYTYKPDGLRLSKTVNGVKTTHVWDGGNIVITLNASGTMIDVYVRGINLIKSNVHGYYLYNAHGDVVQLADSTGSVKKEYKYDAFGNEIDEAEADRNPFRYCGEYLDLETGTYYLRARYYDPSTGRFLTEDTHWNTKNMIHGDSPQDPLGLGIYTPDINAIRQSSNLYMYCSGNPILYIDVNGMEMVLAAVDGDWHSAFSGCVGAIAIPVISIATQIATVVNSVAAFSTDVFTATADKVIEWVKDTFGGGGSGSPGDPNNWNHRDYFLEQVQNKELSNAINELYRKGATIGDGGTADMLRYEFCNGQTLKHLQKANDMIKNLNNILTNQVLTESERKLAYQLVNDLYDAVKLVRK